MRQKENGKLNFCNQASVQQDRNTAKQESNMIRKQNWTARSHGANLMSELCCKLKQSLLTDLLILFGPARTLEAGQTKFAGE